MNNENMLIDFLGGVDLIKNIIQKIPGNCIDYIPNHIDSWTIRQHVIHLVDSDINNFVRIKSCIAQPYSNIYVIKENEWVKNLDNRKENINDYLDVFCLLRKILYNFLITISDDDFQNKYFIRDYNNKITNITLHDAIQNYCDHVMFHKEYIENIHSEYLKTA